METKFFDSSNCESHSKGGFPSRSRLNFSFSTQKLTTAETKPVRRGINHRGNLGRSFFVKFRQVTQTLIRPVWFQHISHKKEKKTLSKHRKRKFVSPKVRTSTKWKNFVIFRTTSMKQQQQKKGEHRRKAKRANK